MTRRTTLRQRREFYVRHRMGETYQQIADTEGLSRECVRAWCRRQRDGGDCQTRYRREPRGQLSQFDPKVPYCILRLRLEHPRWGPSPILNSLRKRSSLRGLRLPSVSSIGRYLHQWPRFRRRRRQGMERQRLHQPTEVHQRWQLDFKMGIALKNGVQVNLHTVREPVGAACIGASVSAAGQVGRNPRKVTLEEVRSTLRTCFTQWKTLPDEIQTDGEGLFVGQPQDSFPSTLTLWLTGLGIDHLVIRPGKPTDNAEVERCHRTLNDYAVVGNEDAELTQLQRILDKSVDELNQELPSRAKDCQGLPPIRAHPELLEPRHPFLPSHELALFDLERVDAYLATFTWQRKVGKTGQITLGGRHQRYSVGRTYAYHQVLVRFDPHDRHFVFYDVQDPDHEIGRRPANGIEVTDLTGLATWPASLIPQQLPLPLFTPKGVDC
jgi:hypothetical protein